MALGRRKSVQQQDQFINAVDLPRSDGDGEMGHALGWIASACMQSHSKPLYRWQLLVASEPVRRGSCRTDACVFGPTCFGSIRVGEL